MKISLETVNTINELSISAPCPVTWDSMKGSNQVRYCEKCDKQVHDLTEMTSAEIVRLVEATEGHFCAQFVRRQDGTLVTAECTGLRLRIWKKLRRTIAWAASVFALVFLPGCPMGGGNMRMPRGPLIEPTARPTVTPAEPPAPILGMVAPPNVKQTLPEGKAPGE